MSNTPELCTKLRSTGRLCFVPILKHRSLALRAAPDGVGRVGPTICGIQGAVDQQRAMYLMHRQGLLLSIKIHELPLCLRCRGFLQ